MKRIYFILFLVLLTGVIAAQVSKTVTATAGNLRTAFTTTERTTVTNLTVTGILDARDFKFMRDSLSVLSVVDISAVNINAYNGNSGTNPYSNSYPANEIPEFSFWQYLNNSYISPLITIKLPNNISSIGNSAFRNCKNLKNIISLNPTPPTVGILVFVVGDMSVSLQPFTVYVPIGAVPTYKAATSWSSFTDIFEYTLRVTTNSATTIALSTATLNGNINLITDTPVTAYGFCWNTTGSPTITDNKVDNGAKTTEGDFSNSISSLTAATKYFIRAYAIDGEGTKYSNEISFTTAVSIGSTTDFVNVTTPGSLSTLLSTTDKSLITNLTVTGSIDSRDVKCMRDELIKLEVLDISGVNILAFNGSGGTAYLYTSTSYPANEMPECSFYYNLSPRFTLKTVILPTSLTKIGNNAFQNYSTLTNITIPSGVNEIKIMGFYNCTSLKIVRVLSNTPPTLGSSCFVTLGPTGPVLHETLIVPRGTLASYIAASGWNNFTNVFEYILTTTTKPVTTITLSTATLNASLDLIADTPVTAYGFCWNTTGSPTVDDNKIDKGATTTLGAYSSNLSNLIQNTTYHVKAYATDGERTVYGSEVTFTTPSIPDAAGIISGAISVCQGQNSVTYTVPTISYATSYIWTLPTGATGTSTSNSITVNYAKTAISGNITVTGHNQWGDGAVSTLAVTASLLPVNAGTISGNASVCQGENSVTYTVPAIDNATSYTWTLPTGATGTSSTNSITVNYGINAVSGNITVKGNNNCGDGVVSTLPIKVNQLPVIAVTDKTVICGGSVSLNATTNYSGSGTVSYQWSPTTGLNDATIANPTATVINDITYTVTINTPNSCSTSKSLSVTIIPMAKPEIGMVGVSSNNKNLIAWNKPVSTGIESYYIYRETNVTNVYEKIGTVPYDSLSIYIDNQSLPDVQANKYKLSIFDRHGLESPQSNYHKTMHLAINKGMGTTWNLSWEAYEGFVVSTYNIYRGTTPANLTLLGSTSGSNTQYNDLNVPTGDVYYQLEVINPNVVNPSKAPSSLQKTKAAENSLYNSLISYNSSRSNIATNAISAINELEENNKINIYPNPLKNELRINFEGGSTFEILNLMGQVVYNGNLIKNTIVQTSNLSSGIYLIKFKSGKTFEYKKIIKE